MSVAAVWPGTGGAVQALGWTLFHSLWQAALVAAGLLLVLRLVPRSMTRPRIAAASVALATVVALAIGTWGALAADWRQHATCWEATGYAREHPALCASHGVHAAEERAAAETAAAEATAATGASRPRAVLPWAWVRLGDLPLPSRTGVLALGASPAMSLLLLLWGAAASVALVHLMSGLYLLQGVVRRSEAVTADGPAALLRRLRRRMGVERHVELRASDEVSAPAIAGWRRPVLLLPPGMTDTLDPAELACVLAHELVHVRRRHFVANLVQRLLESLLVLNPPALWIGRRIREEREASCDDLAAGLQATGRRRYAKTLLRLESLRAPAGPAWIGLLGEGTLLRRIRRLADLRHPRRRVRLARIAAAVGGGLAVGLALVQVSVAAMSISSWALMERDIRVREASVEVGSTSAYEAYPTGPGNPSSTLD